MRLLPLALLALAPALEGCAADPELAPLPSQDALFVAFAQECAKGTREAWFIDAEGDVRHARARADASAPARTPEIIREAVARGLLPPREQPERVEQDHEARILADDLRGLRELVARLDVVSTSPIWEGDVRDGCPERGLLVWTPEGERVMRDAAHGAPQKVAAIMDFVAHAHVD